MRGAACLAATLLAAGLSIGPLAPRGLAGSGTEPVTRLGTDGTRFTVNGRPAFLFGLSYYGALGAPDETVRQDLADLKERGFNWVRVWATWAAYGEDVSAVDGEGRPREPFLQRLERLVAACDAQGIVVDVTLSRGNGSTGPARLQTLEAHRRAVETLVTGLKAHPNWYLDLANERNVKDKRFTSFADLKELRELARTLDPDRLVTASHAGDVSRADLAEYLRTVRVDFLSPHRPRTADSAGQTEARSQDYLAWMKGLGREVPLHYQEPFRRDFGKWQPRAEDYVTDLRGALAGGAAGWCWHNGDNRAAKDGRPRRSFDLREKRLFDQLDDEEGRALPLLSKVIAEAVKGAGAKKPGAGIEGQDGPATPAEQYQAILKDYQKAASGGDGTDEGRAKLIGRPDQLRPFAMIGVNANGYDSEKRKAATDREKRPGQPFADDGFVVGAVLVTGAASAQEPRPGPADVNAAIDRGLAFLARDALAWKKEHNCASCHHASLVVWAMREARSRGHAVEEPVLAELTKWVAESGDGKFGLPRPASAPRAASPKAVYFALALGADPEPDVVSQRSLKLLLKTVAAEQTENGSWSTWPETRPPIFGSSDESLTALATLAVLPAAASGDESAKAVRDKAIRWLAETRTDGDPQSIALRLVLWSRLGRPAEEWRPLVRRIKERQNADGGWGQTKDMASDAWATGQALYALAHAGVRADEPVIRRAHAFLLKTQRADGSWPMTSRPVKPGGEGARSLIPITGAGSAWAVLGLVRGR